MWQLQPCWCMPEQLGFLGWLCGPLCYCTPAWLFGVLRRFRKNSNVVPIAICNKGSLAFNMGLEKSDSVYCERCFHYARICDHRLSTCSGRGASERDTSSRIAQFGRIRRIRLNAKPLKRMQKVHVGFKLIGYWASDLFYFVYFNIISFVAPWFANEGKHIGNLLIRQETVWRHHVLVWFTIDLRWLVIAL